MSEGQRPIGERVAVVEASSARVEEKLGKLDEIATGTALNTQLLQGVADRLKSGDATLKEHATTLAEHGKEIASVKERLKDLDGGPGGPGGAGWPSWVQIQKWYLESKTVNRLSKGAFGALMMLLGVIAAWMTAPIWHR
jgi:hypothetical protein